MESRGQRNLVGYSPWGCQRAEHDLVSKQQCVCEYLYPFIFFIHSSPDGHLGCFCILATVNSTAMNTGYMSIWTVVPAGICPVVGLLDHMAAFSHVPLRATVEHLKMGGKHTRQPHCQLTLRCCSCCRVRAVNPEVRDARLLVLWSISGVSILYWLNIQYLYILVLLLPLKCKYFEDEVLWSMPHEYWLCDCNNWTDHTGYRLFPSYQTAGVFLQDGRCQSVNALASAGWQVQLASREAITHSRVLGSQVDQRAESLLPPFFFFYLPPFIGREAETHRKEEISSEFIPLSFVLASSFLGRTQELATVRTEVPLHGPVSWLWLGVKDMNMLKRCSILAGP